MTQSFVNLGGQPNDGTGDSIRDAFSKINNNFVEVYAGLTTAQSVVNSATYVANQVATIQNFSTTIANFSATQALFQGDLQSLSNTFSPSQSTISALATSSTTAFNNISALATSSTTAFNNISALATSSTTAFNNIGTLSSLISTATTSTLWNGTWTMSVDTLGTVTAYGPIKTIVTTATSLPSAVSAGMGARAFITDATTTTFNDAVVGSGTYMMPVFSNGTDWFIG